MRVMVLVKATKDSEAGIMPSTELLEAMGKYNEELVNAGILVAGEGLQPSAKGKRVAFDGPSRTVIDGPSPRPASWSPASGYGRSRTSPRRSSG
jgi:hypothetical protein